MAQITIEEVEAAIKSQTAARDQAMAQANFHAGCLGAWQEMLAHLQSPDVTDGAPEADAAPDIKPIARNAVKKASGNGLNLAN